MDDPIDSVQSQEDANNEVDFILSKAGFKVKEWTVTGDQQTVGEARRAVDEKCVTIEENVLGIKWHVTSDEISCNPNINNARSCELGASVLMKRILLRFMNGLYDPFGIAASVIIKEKLVTRFLWTDEKHLNWDDHIPKYHEQNWRLFFKELDQSREVRFKR